MTTDCATPAPPRPEEVECILVVEDDEMLRRILVKLLRGWGFAILEACDGGAAIRQIASGTGRLQVVLLDIMLPVLSGVEVARRVLRDRPDLPIVACSAALDATVEADLRQIGVRHFLPKPYSADSLRASLESAIKG